MRNLGTDLTIGRRRLFVIAPELVDGRPTSLSIGLVVWVEARTGPSEKRRRELRFKRKVDVTALAQLREAENGRALRTAIVNAARSVGMIKEAEVYLGVPVSAFPGRRPGSPSRRKQPVIERGERDRVARQVHANLESPQIYEKIAHGALKEAVGRVSREENLPDKVVDACYRDFKDKLQGEMAFIDWDEWLKGYKAHGFARVRSGKPAITRAEALQFYRGRLLRRINGLSRLKARLLARSNSLCMSV